MRRTDEEVTDIIMREQGLYDSRGILEKIAVGVLLEARAADTVRGALDDIAERDDAHARALERRAGFSVVSDPEAKHLDTGE